MSTPDLKPASFTKPIGSVIPEIKSAQASLKPQADSSGTHIAAPVAPKPASVGSLTPELNGAKALLTPRVDSVATRSSAPAPSATPKPASVGIPAVAKAATKSGDVDAQKLISTLEQNKKKQKELQEQFAALETRQKAEREALRVSIVSLSKTKADNDDRYLKFATWCLNGLFLRDHPDLAIDLLEALKRDPKRPAHHAEAIEHLLIVRKVLKDPNAPKDAKAK